MSKKKNSRPPLTWRTEKRKVSELVPYAKNPRILTPKQEADLKRSVEKFNLVEIPAINADGTVIAGHQRLHVMRLLNRGEELIDVRVPSRQLSEEEFKEYLLRSNANHASWDFGALANDFSVDFLVNAGLQDDDLATIFDDVLSVEDDDLDLERAVREAKTTKIKSGDLFQIGPHRLMCGNSEDPEVVKRLVGGATAIDLVNIDFPYNTGWLSYNSGVGGKQAYGGIHVNDKKSDSEYRAFLKNIMTNAVSVSKENSHYFFWMNETYVGMMQELMKECGVEFKRLCCWLKGQFNPVPSCAFNKAAEWCSYGTRGKNPYLSNRVKNLTEVMNREIESGNRMPDDFLDLLSVWIVKRLPMHELEHPTMKPPSLYEKSLRRCSRPGDAVLDLCCGSGSLGIACESLRRKSFLCDQEPVFCQVVINRMKQNFNLHAKKISR